MPKTMFSASSPAISPLTGQATTTLAAAFEHQLHARLPPGHRGGLLLLGVRDGLAAHKEAARIGLHRLLPAAMDGIEGQQVRGGVGVAAGVVDVHQLDAGPAPEGAEHQPTNAAEAVDADAHVVRATADTLPSSGVDGSYGWVKG